MIRVRVLWWLRWVVSRDSGDRGLGKGSLYAAFGDKHQLFLWALRSYTDGRHGSLRTKLTSAPRALDALRAFVMAPVSDSSGAAARRGCLMANSTYELATTDPTRAGAG